MKHVKFNITIILVCLLLAFIPMNSSFADDLPEDQDNGEIVQEEAPAFKNPTEAQRAINLAEAYAEKPDPEIEKALDEVDRAQKEYDDALAEEEDEETLEGLFDALTEAKQNAENLVAENAEVTPEDIHEMREDGMGWGEIAHELGLHPSLLGMRHTNRYQNRNGWGHGVDPDGEISDSEIEQATKRNFKSGDSKGHGSSVNKGNNGKSNSGKETGNKGGKGNKSDKGNNGNGGGKKK